MKTLRIITILCAFAIAVAGTTHAQKKTLDVSGVDAPHGDPAKLTNLCADCHFGYDGAGATATINDKCLSCHNGTTAPAEESHRGLSCTTCHNPHHQEQERTYGSAYSKLVRAAVGGKQVKLMASSGPNSFADGDAVRDGICEVCHTTTAYHRADGGGAPHNEGADCTTCHSHDLGFSAGAGGTNCLGCHQGPMGSRRAVAPDFAGPKPHHPLTYDGAGDLGTPADNNCLVCHNDYPDLHANGVVNLRSVPDSSGAQADWAGSNPSPWCLTCHDGNNPDPQYRLGGQTATNKSSYFTGANAHQAGPGLSDGCQACHDQSNGHTQPVQFYSNFYLDDKEENMCYGCHGGGANVSTGGRYMENIRVAFAGGSVTSRSRHANAGDLGTSDGHVFCRDCHDPHLLNHTTNILIDPQNITQPWAGTMNDFCGRCHDGTKAPAPSHTGVTLSASCTDCHLPHSSTLPSLANVSLAGKSLVVSPSSAAITLGGSQQFDAIVSPAYPEYTQAVVDRLAQWSFSTTSGGSAGTEYPRADPIPLDRSIGYDPAGYGLITVSSSMTIADIATIEDIDIYANIRHHYRGDIELDLTHVETGTTVRVQAYDWNDWLTDLVFWYDSESPNSQHGSLSPRSTAGSLTAFNGESVAGTWRLTIRDTWPTDNATDTTSPDYCRFNSWALRVNGNVVGWFSETGQFQSAYAGTGTVYSKLHNGKIIPVQSGLDVSVSENPLPLQSTASLTVNPLYGMAAHIPIVRQEQARSSEAGIDRRHPTPGRLSTSAGAPARGKHATGSRQECASCHRR
jgi:subtilisin-like proprotein convertase family protein